MGKRQISKSIVAPRAGAWIETLTMPLRNKTGLSHPVRVRGLKHFLFGFQAAVISVAPRAGAWIETLVWNVSSGQDWSHPVRVRGLKRI